MTSAQLRALQDWFLKYELKTVPNVAEVASVGGMVRQYQVVLDPDKLRAYGITAGQGDRGRAARPTRRPAARCWSWARPSTWSAPPAICKTLDDFRADPARRRPTAGVPVRLGDVARVQIGPEMRRGIAELNGEGEVAGGVIVMRSGKNALETIEAVKAKLAELKQSLPPGVEIVPTYDRSSLIERAVDNLERQADRGVHRRGAGLRRCSCSICARRSSRSSRCRSGC